jgi:hypothetical protein
VIIDRINHSVLFGSKWRRKSKMVDNFQWAVTFFSIDLVSNFLSCKKSERKYVKGAFFGANIRAHID